MSYTSGSSLNVLLENGASPNTGPFDIYINSISSSGNLIANDVAKTTLSSSGYPFIAPVEVFSVWVKSDGTVTNADVAILSEIPGYNKTVGITGSYNESLIPGLNTVIIFLDNGYGLQDAGNVPSSLNVCPSVIGTGTGSINSSFNTLVVVKSHETGSNYVKFFANGAPSSNYYYHIPSFSGSGVNVVDVDVCMDLSAGNYQTVATNSINVYPSASIKPILTYTSTPGQPSETNGWSILKVNGTTIYSSSFTGNVSPIPVPGNAFVEITSSLLQANSWVLGNNTLSTSSINITWIYNHPEYDGNTVYSSTKSQILSGSTDANLSYYNFYAVPGGEYTLTITDTIILT